MDRSLVIRAQQGDREAFARIVDLAYDRYHAVALRLLRDLQLAEDATQQALVNIWRDLPRLRDPSRFDGWSYRLLVRACYAEFKKAPRWMAAIEPGMPDEPRVADEYEAILDRDQLERGFRGLSIEHRAVVVLHHYLDLPLDEIATVLAIPIGTVKSRLHRALAEMRATLDADSRPASRPPQATAQPQTSSTGAQVMR